jgi:hypothetical protein
MMLGRSIGQVCENSAGADGVQVDTEGIDRTMRMVAEFKTFALSRRTVVIRVAAVVVGASLLAILLARSLAVAQPDWPAPPDRHQIGLDAAATAPLCRTRIPLLTKRSLGPLHPGQSLRDVQGICPRLVYGWHGDEGDLWTPVAVTRLGPVSVVIEFSGTEPDSSVYRISTSSDRARTRDGFGPGVLLSAMAAAWGAPRFAVGECVLYAWFHSRPGLSFRIGLPHDWDCVTSARLENTGDMRLLPRGTRITEVLLFSAPGQ